MILFFFAPSFQLMNLCHLFIFFLQVVRSACRTALLEANFTPDDYYYDPENPDGPPDEPPSEMDLYGETPDKMTYTEQGSRP